MYKWTQVEKNTCKIAICICIIIHLIKHMKRQKTEIVFYIVYSMHMK